MDSGGDEVRGGTTSEVSASRYGEGSPLG